jgi:hypothetical protein
MQVGRPESGECSTRRRDGQASAHPERRLAGLASSRQQLAGGKKRTSSDVPRAAVYGWGETPPVLGVSDSLGLGRRNEGAHDRWAQSGFAPGWHPSSPRAAGTLRHLRMNAAAALALGPLRSLSTTTGAITTQQRRRKAAGRGTWRRSFESGTPSGAGVGRVCWVAGGLPLVALHGRWLVDEVADGRLRPRLSAPLRRHSQADTSVS